MENDREKPGPKPYIWDERLGPVRNRGQRYPAPGHEILKKHAMMALVEKMALDPAFEIQVLGLVEKPEF